MNNFKKLKAAVLGNRTWSKTFLHMPDRNCDLLTRKLIFYPSPNKIKPHIYKATDLDHFIEGIQIPSYHSKFRKFIKKLYNY